MTLLEAVLYGAVQGITEYLPVSSSAHLILLPRFLSTADPGLAFDVFLHLGTLIATLAYFWKDWREILVRTPWVGPRLGAPRSEAGFATASWDRIVLVTLPVLIAGALFHRQAETIFRGNQVLIATLVLGAILLVSVDSWAARRRDLGSLRPVDALVVGVAQCLALIPGMSRSGSTIMGARLVGLDRASAARFSFLASAPVTLAAIVFELRKWPELVSGPVGLGPLLVAGFCAFLFGILAIGFLLRLLRRFGYLSFAIYRVLLAGAIFYLLGPG